MSCLFTAQLTNLLHTAESSWGASSSSPSQDIPFILWIPKFCYHDHLTLSWARIVQSTSSHPTFLRSILIVSSKPQPTSSKWSLSFQFPLKKTHMHSFSPHMYCMTNPSHSSWSYHPHVNVNILMYIAWCLDTWDVTLFLRVVPTIQSNILPPSLVSMWTRLDCTELLKTMMVSTDNSPHQSCLWSSQPGSW